MPYAISQPAVEAPSQHVTGDVAAGFWCDCLPFTCTATLTVAITTLDVITDWLMYRAFLEVTFSERVQAATVVTPGPCCNGTHVSPVVWRYRNVYVLLPLLLQIFCILGTLVCAFDLSWMSWMFTVERKKFKDRRDGLPHKPSAAERHTGDVFVFFHVLLHDLPVPAILLAVQVAITCHFVLPLGHVIYVIAMVTTMVSLLWKLLQVAISSGCLQQCDDEVPCNPVSWIVRALTLMLVCLAVVVTAFNIVLLTGWRTQVVRPPLLGTEMMGKVPVDMWLRQDAVYMMEEADQDAAATLAPSADGSNNTAGGPFEMTPLYDIFAAGQHGVFVELLCGGRDNRSLLLPRKTSVKVLNPECLVSFFFQVSQTESVIYFDYRLREADGSCPDRFSLEAVRSSPFPRGSHALRPGPLIDDGTSTRKAVLMENSTRDHYVEWDAQASSSAAPSPTPTDLPTVEPTDPGPGQQLPRLWLWVSASSHRRCQYDLVRNTSLLTKHTCLDRT